MSDRPPQKSIASFDSSAAMLRATAQFLHGEDFSQLGVISEPLQEPMQALLSAVNWLPRKLKDEVYVVKGASGAVPDDCLESVNLDGVAEWATGEYPERQYPAVMLGSSNGALVHLCVALGVPWLPQTFLVPVRHGHHEPDELEQELKWCIDPAARLLARNPGWNLHHMHDPNQDRLMVQRMSYFRVKCAKMPPAYRDFLRKRLQPGGTIYVVDCTAKWPVHTLQDRHYFQFGAAGGLPAAEYFEESERVRHFLEQQGAKCTRWHPPAPDSERPEAEWGFEQAIMDDVLSLAEEEGYGIHVLRFPYAEAMTPLVAELYARWNEQRGIQIRRLLVENFILLAPYWTLRTGSIPLWLFFNTQDSLQTLREYLKSHSPVAEIFLMLFSNGLEAAGVARIEEWEQVLAESKALSSLIGVDRERYPADFAVYARYNEELREKLKARYPMPPPLSEEFFLQFMQEWQGRGPVELETLTPEEA